MADKAQSVDKAGRNNSYSKKKHKKEIDDATNTDARERLVEDCHLADDEVRNLEEEYNKVVEDLENTKVQRLKNHNYKVAQAKDAVEKFDKLLLQEEKRSKCGSFIGYPIQNVQMQTIFG